MAGSVFGDCFRLVTFGESHGAAVGVVIDGLQPNLEIDVSEIQKELDRRKPGQSSITTQRKESDTVQIISGIFEGKTTGTPLCMIVQNEDQKSKDYGHIKDVFRPGHAGYTFLKKYGIYDYRGGGRASGRETISRVAAGAVAKQLLRRRNIKILAYVKSVGNIEMQTFSEAEIENNIVRTPDPIAAEKMIELIHEARKDGDSVGGIVELRIEGIKPGVGEPVFDKLEAELAKACMSIGAVKGFEIGDGFASATKRGSECNDEFYINSETHEVATRTNHTGGIQGGISNGMDIIARVAIKPTASIQKKQMSVSTSGEEVEFITKGRHDPCICPRVVPVIEAMAALVLIDLIMLQEQTAEPKLALEEVRTRIDLLDQQLLLVLVAREHLVLQIAKIKKQTGKDVYDSEREKIVTEQWASSARQLGLNEELILKIKEMILHHSKSLQYLDTL